MDFKYCRKYLELNCNTISDLKMFEKGRGDTESLALYVVDVVDLPGGWRVEPVIVARVKVYDHLVEFSSSSPHTPP